MARGLSRYRRDDPAGHRVRRTGRRGLAGVGDEPADAVLHRRPPARARRRRPAHPLGGLLVALRPDEFYDHAIAAADGDRRLPLARMTGWDISPFEADGLRVTPLRPPVLPEPARHGEDPTDCSSCRSRDEGLWFDERWRLTRIGGVGVPLALMLHPRDHYDLADLPDAMAAELGVLTKHIAGH